MIEVNRLKVGYGDMLALNEVSFDVKKGEIVSIIGSNGAGKTTLVNTISGLLKSQSGDIKFKGLPIIKLAPHLIVETGLIQVPEGRKLFSNLTVKDNLRLGSYVKRAKNSRNETMEKVFDLFPILNKRAKQLAGTLSGGEQQMLAFGRGLMSIPELLILDEPSLGLAPLIVEDIFEVINKINSEGVTILLIEQNTVFALQCCTRAYVLENGKIVMKGNGGELLNDQHIIEAYLGL